MVRISDATPLDIPAIVACMRLMHAESRTHSRFAFDEETVAYILAKVLAQPDPSTQLMKIATDDETGDVVGMVGAEVVPDMWTKSTVASAHMIYVIPEHRGTLGLDMMAIFLEWARTRADRIETQVSAGINDERGGRLMEAHGLEPRGRLYGTEF